MVSADKRAKLLSDLLAAKGDAAGDGGGAVETERAAVIPIAARRPADDRPSEAPAGVGVLYSKGAATASTFRPSYWSFDHDAQAAPNAELVKTEPLPAPAAQKSRSKALPINFVVVFGCAALLVSTTLFVLSQRHQVDVVAQPETRPTLAGAPERPPMSAAPVAPQPAVVAPSAAARAEPAAAVPMPAADSTPIVPTPAPVPPAAAVAPAPRPVAPEPAPIASESPSPTIAEPTARAPASVEPAPAVASTTTQAPAPASDTRQVNALLSRGDDLLATGDVSAARLFYQRAAELGSAAAATAVGQTYDPGVLELLRVRGARGDVPMATEWYRKAIAAGDRQAEIRLKRLLARSPG